MSFHEKSAWACLVCIVGVYCPYFTLVFAHPMAFIGLFPLAAILLAVLLTAFHIVYAVVTPSVLKKGDVPRLDELDRIIELRAAKVSGIVLAVAVSVWCMCAMFAVPAISAVEIAHAKAPNAVSNLAQFQVPVSQALTAIQLMFAGFVIANTAYYAAIIAGYRRLAHG